MPAINLLPSTIPSQHSNTSSGVALNRSKQAGTESGFSPETKSSVWTQAHCFTRMFRAPSIPLVWGVAVESGELTAPIKYSHSQRRRLRAPVLDSLRAGAFSTVVFYFRLPLIPPGAKGSNIVASKISVVRGRGRVRDHQAARIGGSLAFSAWEWQASSSEPNLPAIAHGSLSPV